MSGSINTLLAPNGKPSNLTPEQYKLVRTPAFKQWFGDWEKLAAAEIKDSGIDNSTLEMLGRNVSKVVDENGEPLVVYHGGYIDFNVFDVDKTANKRFHFTPSKEYAEFRGQVSKAYFLKIIELYYVDWQQRRTLKKSKGEFSGYANLLNDIKNLNEIVVFEPNQIKLADGTNTTFDPNNPDIRFEDGGIMPNPKNIKIGDYVQYEKWFYTPIYAIRGTVLEFKKEDFLDINMRPVWKVKILIDKKIDYKKDKLVPHQKTTMVLLEKVTKINKDGSIILGQYSIKEGGGEMGNGGVFDENINVPSTEELIEIVRNVREKKIKEWYELGERVVVGRNDGYWWEISPRESESILARNPSKKKVLEIIKNNPNITEIHFNGSIKTGTKVGEELEIADDFDVVIWKKQEQIVLPNNADIFQEGLSFAYVDDKGKFINVIVNAKDTQRYSQIDETDLSDKYIYVLSYNKENKNTFEYRIVKEEFKEGVNDGDIVFTKEKFKDGGEVKEYYQRTYADGTIQKISIEDYENNILPNLGNGGDLKVNDMKSEISVSDIDRKYSNLSHKFINKQLMMGIEIEMEHTDNPEVAKKIALDHLNESPYYYQELEKMESRLEKKNVDSHFEDIKRAYAEGGTTDEMFSFSTPSGEKSKLTYIQQVLVRTSAFKKFFGDWEIAGKRYIKDGKENFEKHFKDVSKVIDFVTLEPRVVYHGTRAEQEFFNFDVTREKGVGRPYAYFANNKPYAENFTRVSQRQDLDSKPFLYECFLNVRNPFMANGHEFTDKSKDAESWLKAIVGRIVWDKYRTINRDDFTKAVESTVESQIGNYLEQVYSDRKDKFWKLMARDTNKDFKFFLLAYDYDGIFYSEEFSGEYDVENPAQFTFAITIFDARQVKLADGRNTKFDPLNSDIRYADGGATEPIINNTQNENDMNKLEQLSGMMKNGGAIYKDGGSVKGNGKHTNDAKGGGYFDGNSHADGGIKAINKDTGQIIEVEGNEVIINKRSVGDTTKREFEGEMLTNREILSKINESGGGVKFADGGEMEHSTCGCSGKKYKYGGETLEDYVILHRISKSTSPKEDSQNLIKQVYG